MKGVILLALKQMAIARFGQETWSAALEQIGVSPDLWVLPVASYEDAFVLQILNSLCICLNTPFEQLAEAFGDYWVSVYTQKRYASHYVGVRTAKQFLLKMDTIHNPSTLGMPDARPPRFKYEWKKANTLIMHYQSERGLIDLMIGLIKGVAKFYQEDLEVTKLGEDRVEIVFPSPQRRKEPA